ncbi:uracil-DNA glycosylase family protein [Entomospira nematocerorum]|uniref:Uracil-DNA glycosylase-like domain-containing protein n=1 Tax=Entomospira nematocerorum TaxID=2719987 RepID=A0A968GFB5_9SPIO|nr:uracil-DNA glycosylase family protein [Entomospira nematocera]NIZ47230.1 hypothetical protein [Entomospira nematocera]WDI34228.1 uracil-DNA glycosylase family protein [Entomospira nematocera]
MSVEPLDTLWRITHQIEALILYDGWALDNVVDIRSKMEKSQDTLEQSANVVEDGYSFLSTISHESSTELLDNKQEDNIVSEQSTVAHLKPDTVLSSDWQELQRQLKQMDYQPLHAFTLNPSVMVIVSYDGDHYHDAQEYIYKWMDAIHLKEESVYITRVMKARRDETYIEILPQEGDVVKQEIALIQPQSILVCGRLAYESLFNHVASISKSRMKKHRYVDVPVVVTYDPQTVLQFPILRKDVWADIQRLQKLLERGF